MRRFLFTAAVTVISRACIARDRITGRIAKSRLDELSSVSCTRCGIPSGRNVLDALYLEPARRPVRAAILLCHGIGEIVDHWLPVQRLLAASGVASLVFDYSGYGCSSGWIDANQCERDAVAAFRRLRELAPAVPLSLLGFSLGSGIAAAIVNEVPASRLFLCAAFASLREAAHSLGFPKALDCAIAPIWRAEDSLRLCAIPITIVHGEEDELFSIRRARDLKALCPPRSELILVPGLRHNAPFYDPQPAYWNLILDRLPENIEGLVDPRPPFTTGSEDGV